MLAVANVASAGEQATLSGLVEVTRIPRHTPLVGAARAVKRIIETYYQRSGAFRSLAVAHGGARGDGRPQEAVDASERT